MRLNPFLILGAAVIIAAVIAGCTAPGSVSPAPVQTEVPQPAPVQTTQTPQAVVTTQLTTIPATMIPTTATTTASPAAYSVEVRSSPFGQILADRHGMTLYYYGNDVQGSKASTCYEQCAATWQPYYAGAAMTVQPPLDPTQFSTITRTDVTQQTAYYGRPLYTYTYDSGPGSTIGAGIGNLWYVAGISGTLSMTTNVPTPTSSFHPLSPSGSGGY